MSRSLLVRLPNELAERLDGVAKETGRSESFVIEKALEFYQV